MKKLLIAVLVVPLLTPAALFAAGDFEISAWIPYWKSEAGVTSILPNLSSFTEVNPFMYTVKEDGSLNQAGKLTDAEWVQLSANAKTNNVRFVPTVMWSGSDSIHRILSDPTLRAAHIKSIASEVYKYDLDGIDIDYEAKYAKTRPYFSLFLKELEEAIGYDRWLMCTIESRTPLDSRYLSPEDIPSDIEYSNEFAEINKYCDRVRIMAYDQGRFDLRLNGENGHPYIPVADTAWVEKVMRLALEEISADKLTMGIATYGYEYDMFLGNSGRLEYSRLWSFNPRYPDETITKYGLTVQRIGGEAVVTYPASQSLDPIIPLPHATRVMVWSDATAVAEKVALAKSLGIRGVSVFKIDGGQDAEVFAKLAPHAVANTSTRPAIGNVATAGGGSTGGASSGSTGGSSTGSITMPTRDLQTGSTGEDVRALQRFLNAEGYILAAAGEPGSPGYETTKFGAATRGALARFQKAHGISPAVGYYGPITRGTIAKLALR